MKLIDKDTAIAEIDRRMKLRYDSYKTHRTLSDFIVWEELEYFKEEFLPTLEVKEVDLEKELVEWHKEHFKKDGTFIGKSGFYLTNNSQMDIAKHFFELGLKTQKGE